MLTKELAEQWLEDEDSLNLSQFTYIEDAAAESLSRHEGDLELNGLTSLSDAAAESLSKYQGYSLSLNGLTTLSDRAAISLSRFIGETLLLNGVATLSAIAGDALADYDGDLSLNSLATLTSPALATRLVWEIATVHVDAEKERYSREEEWQEEEWEETCPRWSDFGEVALPTTVTELSPEAARAIVEAIVAVNDKYPDMVSYSECGNGSLKLNGLRSLPVEVALELARHRGYLSISGVTVLSAAAAEALASIGDETINLSGLREMPDDVAEALARHKGHLRLDGIKRWSRVAQRRFESGGVFYLSRVFWRTELDDPPRPDRADPPGTLTNSIGMKLVPIPAGKFMMGSPPSEEGRYDSEQQHEVTLTKDFYLGLTQVTQAQYEQVMGTNPSYFKVDEVFGKDISEYPVEQVSWDDAVAFCEMLSAIPEEKAAGRVYRLPTEAEWEYACRSGSNTRYHFGDKEELLGKYAWYKENSKDRTHPVALKEPNALGLFDMHGNVYEWCSDWYGGYPEGIVTDPIGQSDGSLRVRRGGSWCIEAADCRSADRYGDVPSDRIDNIGFRVALSSGFGIPN